MFCLRLLTFPYFPTFYQRILEIKIWYRFDTDHIQFNPLSTFLQKVVFLLLNCVKWIKQFRYKSNVYFSEAFNQLKAIKRDLIKGMYERNEIFFESLKVISCTVAYGAKITYFAAITFTLQMKIICKEYKVPLLHCILT